MQNQNDIICQKSKTELENHQIASYKWKNIDVHVKGIFNDVAHERTILLWWLKFVLTDDEHVISLGESSLHEKHVFTTKNEVRSDQSVTSSSADIVYQHVVQVSLSQSEMRRRWLTQNIALRRLIPRRCKRQRTSNVHHLDRHRSQARATSWVMKEETSPSFTLSNSQKKVFVSSLQRLPVYITTTFKRHRPIMSSG